MDAHTDPLVSTRSRRAATGGRPYAVTLAIAVALTAALSAQSRRPLTVDDMFALKSVSDPQVSPDGRWVAYAVSAVNQKKDNADTDLYMTSLVDGSVVRLTSSDQSEHSPRWSPDGRFIAFLSSRDQKKTQVFLLDRRGGDAQALTHFKASVSSLAWSPDSRRLALVVSDVDPDDPDFAAAGEDGKKPAPKPIVITRLQFMRDTEGYLTGIHRHLYIVDVASGAAVQVTSGAYDDSSPVWSPDGLRLAFVSNRTSDPDRNENTDIFVVDAHADATPRAVTTSAGSDRSPAFSPDGRTIAYLAGGDPADIWYATDALATIPTAGGPPTILTNGLDRNVSHPQFSADGRRIYFEIEEGGDTHIARIPSAGGTLARVLDGEHDVSTFDLTKTGALVYLDSQWNQPPEISQLGTAAGAAPARVTHVNDALMAGLDLGKVERFKAKSADGTVIDGFLTRPPNAPAGRKLPAILRIHGGPVSQFTTAFNFEWQILAAQGYAVIAANPRGSSGYGRDFSRAIFADWGNKDYDDVMAAVDQVIAMGVADPDRLGVGGWSYGGILTDHVISKTHRFKAAISGASEFNYLANYGVDQYQHQWEAELGLPWRNPQAWMKISPFFRLDQITTPTLVMGGTADMNVPLIGGEQLYQGLKRLGRDTELVVYPGEHHSIRRPSYQKDRYERYIAWYDHYLKPKPASTGGGD